MINKSLDAKYNTLRRVKNFHGDNFLKLLTYCCHPTASILRYGNTQYNQ